MKIEFVDLAAQRALIGDRIDAAVLRALDRGAYVMGPEVLELESRLAAFCGVSHAISCANGTDALALVLRAKRIGPGDAVICPSFTFAATGEAVACVGAVPVFADVQEETYNLSPESLAVAVVTARTNGLRPVGVIAVDLFGQPADYDTIQVLCAREGLWLLCDAAQSFGASYKGCKVGSIGMATTTSFFPAKPLGCYGDGGAVFTNDDDLAITLRSLRVHGQGADKYDNIRIGMNSRLDTIQAAVLLEKLAIFANEIECRCAVARRYDEELEGIVKLPRVPVGVRSTWAQYTVRVHYTLRAKLISDLRADGIPTAVYYPRPMHLQSAYQHFPVAKSGASVAECLSTEVLSLPMHPYLKREQQDWIIERLKRGLAESV